jgi:hypothetical protein
MSGNLIGSKIKFFNEDVGVSLPQYKFDIDFDGTGKTEKVNLLLGHTNNLYFHNTGALVGKITKINKDGTCDIAWGEGYPKKIKKSRIITLKRKGVKTPATSSEVTPQPSNPVTPNSKPVAPNSKPVALKAVVPNSKPVALKAVVPNSKPVALKAVVPKTSKPALSQASEPVSPQTSDPVLPNPAPKPKLRLSKKKNNSDTSSSNPDITTPSKKKPTIPSKSTSAKPSAPSKKKPGLPPVPSVETTVKPTDESGSEESGDYSDEEFESDSD